MSERVRRRNWRWVAATAALLSGTTSAAFGQQAANLTAMSRHFAQRGLEAKRAQKLREHEYLASHNAVVRAGLMVVFARPEMLAEARTALTVADSIVRGDWLPALSSDTVYYRLRHDSIFLGREVVLDHVTPAGETVTPRVEWIVERRRHEAVGLGERLAVSFHKRQFSLLPADLAGWMREDDGGNRVQPQTWQRLFTQFALSAARPARDCVAGQLDACRTSLGFLSTADTLTDWLDAARRREMVVQYRSWRNEGYRSPDDEANELHCVEQHDDSACFRFLHDHRLTVQPAPLEARPALVRFAAELGGNADSRRMAFSAPGLDVESRVARVAGVPPAELIRKFRERMIVERPREVAPSASALWATTGWVLVLGMLALRSDRWR